MHDLLGRLYTDEEWEALCNCCGLCCYESRNTDTGWVHTKIPCRYLSAADMMCGVYEQRFEAEKDCIRVTPSVVLAGMMPAECTYVLEMQRIAEEDFGSAGDIERKRKRKQKKRRKRRREAGP